MSHRDALLAGARRCLEEKGYARTTARDLVAASGTNLASIGYHFGSKEALLNEAIGEAFEEWTAQVGEAAFVSPDAAPLERMAAAWKAMREGFADCRPLLVAWVEAVAQAERSPALRAQLAAVEERCREQVATMVRASLGPGSEAQARVVASFLIAVCDGLALQWLLDEEGTPGGEELVEGLAAALTQAVAG